MEASHVGDRSNGDDCSDNVDHGGLVYERQAVQILGNRASRADYQRATKRKKLAGQNAPSVLIVKVTRNGQLAAGHCGLLSQRRSGGVKDGPHGGSLTQGEIGCLLL
jgi:hypothetical protein